jgi:hypothetical protein
MTRPWLFSRSVDLGVFGGSAIVALIAVAAGIRLGVTDDTPAWAWIAAVLFVDVAHVHATLFRTYLDRGELQRRPLLYTFVPLACFVIAFALYQSGALLFWRCAAYLAVFHFVRQQYGWVALYRSRAGERDRFGWFIDTTAIYASTLYPLLWWHTHLPRSFWWFVPNDFALQLPPIVMTIAAPLYWLALIAYAARSIARGVPNPGKDVVVMTTALCWYVGIIALNSDYAFTVTNVVIHGVPYFALIYFYGRAHGSPESVTQQLLRRGPFALLGIVWVLAFIEEAAWDHTLWHEHPQFFGQGFSLESVASWLVPLLAVPQLTHYVLDGFIWKRRSAQPLFVTSAPAVVAAGAARLAPENL